MTKPVMQDKVCVEGCEDTFLVVSVDHERQRVDLISTIGGHGGVENVRFELLQPVMQVQRSAA